MTTRPLYPPFWTIWPAVWDKKWRFPPDPRSSRTYELRDSDIVFIDILMPHVSGIQVLEQLARQNVKSAIVPMSGQGDRLNEAEKLTKKLGLYLIGVLEKPFRLADVKSILEGV